MVPPPLPIGPPPPPSPPASPPPPSLPPSLAEELAAATAARVGAGAGAGAGASVSADAEGDAEVETTPTDGRLTWNDGRAFGWWRLVVHQLGTLDGVQLNTPDDAQTLDVELRSGDTVLLATDGCFDALHPLELMELVHAGRRDGASAEKLATTVVETAIRLSKEAMRLSPIVLALQREGWVARSREAQDDVTVVVAFVP